MPMREQSRIKADTVAEECTCSVCHERGCPNPAPEPPAPPKCEPWCGGELCPGTGSEFCKCLDVDRYFCTPACMAAEQPMRPCQPVPAHEAWKLRRMANSWKEHAEQVADGLARRFNQPSAPPAGVPVCPKCGRPMVSHAFYNDGPATVACPPPSAPVTVATDCHCPRHPLSMVREAKTYPDGVKIPALSCEECALEKRREAVATGGVPAGFRLGDGWVALKDGQTCTNEFIPRLSYGCGNAAKYAREENDDERDEPGIARGMARACDRHAVEMGALVPIDTARSVPPGTVHPATGTTCTRCGQVIQSVLPAFPPVETVDGWRHERCPEVPPEPVPWLRTFDTCSMPTHAKCGNGTDLRACWEHAKDAIVARIEKATKGTT